MSYPTDDNCVFCKIVAGVIPCHQLYEDDRVLAFLDVGPLSEGHALVIPKGHYETIDQVPADEAAAMMRVVPALSRAIMQATGAEGWNLLQNNGGIAGQAVPHVHLHIIPRPGDSSRSSIAPGQGLPFSWPAGEVDHTEAEKLAAQIHRAIAG